MQTPLFPTQPGAEVLGLYIPSVTMQDGQKSFRVIIVGGSVAGLTLAHSLLKCNIDFVVLESNCDIAPQVGASIGILPNGARILDQLDLFDDILHVTEPLQKALSWSGGGKIITASDSPRMIHERYDSKEISRC